MSRQLCNEINDEAVNLSPIKNFISLDEAIRSGGQRAERAQRIIAQFASPNATKNAPAAHESGSEMPSSRKPSRSFSSGGKFKRR